MTNIINKPLIISINGGLGNQLFMLFTGISKAIDENRDFLIFLEDNKRKFYFNDFFNHLNHLVINYNSYQVNIVNIYNEFSHNFNPIPNNIDLIKGYFQSYKYFEHNIDKLYDRFNIYHFQQLYSHKNKTIAIHFRIGDYKHLTHYHTLLNINYYINAIHKLISLLSDINDYQFIIYGEKNDDDLINLNIQQLKQNFNFLNFKKIYDLYDDLTDYKEFIYMSNSHHFIIANSSFSWFAAYLATNKNKIIIHPNKSEWFGKLININVNDMIPSNWIEISC